MEQVILWEGTVAMVPTDFGPVDTLVIDGIPRAWVIDRGDAFHALKAIRGMHGKIVFIPRREHYVGKGVMSGQTHRKENIRVASGEQRHTSITIPADNS